VHQVAKSSIRKIVTILNLFPDAREYCRIPDV
jgi:hypothetical protein